MLTLSHPAQNGVVWSGNIWGATGCDIGTGVCETAICSNGIVTQNGECPTYRGPVGPVTRAEFTLQSTQPDFYDITLIDGVNLPIEVKPMSLTADFNASWAAAGPSGIARDYWCGNPGGTRANNVNLSSCSWTFNSTYIPGYGDQSIYLTLVANSTDPTISNSNCTKDSDCPHGQICGTLQQLDPTTGVPMNDLLFGRCGRFIGLWNAHGICAWPGAPNTSPFCCSTSSQLYGCSTPYNVSGYSNNCNQSKGVVCGCPSWESVGIIAPATAPCQCDNNEWNQTALPWIQWMKKACPTAYAFPFDDNSSTFQCKIEDPGSNTNAVNYTITFCPDGRNVMTLSAISAVGVGHNTEIYFTSFAAAIAIGIIVLL